MNFFIVFRRQEKISIDCDLKILILKIKSNKLQKINIINSIIFLMKLILLFMYVVVKNLAWDERLYNKYLNTQLLEIELR